MEVGAVSAQQLGIGPGTEVMVRMADGVTVLGKVDHTVSPFGPKSELYCVVMVPIPASELRRP